MLIGYARISTAEQNLDLQIDALTQAGCRRIFADTASGAKIDRPELNKAFDACHADDTLVVWKLDRLGRSLPHLIDTVASLSNRGVGFKNSDSVGSLKEHPMLPEVFRELRSIWESGATGLVFKDAQGDFFSYRQIQAVYNRAFEACGFTYRSTHVLRHGGTRKTLEETKGDRDIAQQQLGNRDRKTVDIYAQRSPSAFRNYALDQWAKFESGLPLSVAVNGCKWL